MTSLTLLRVNTRQAHPSCGSPPTMLALSWLPSVGQAWILVEANKWLAFRRDRCGH